MSSLHLRNTQMLSKGDGQKVNEKAHVHVIVRTIDLKQKLFFFKIFFGGHQPFLWGH